MFALVFLVVCSTLPNLQNEGNIKQKGFIVHIMDVVYMVFPSITSAIIHYLGEFIPHI